MFSSFPLQRAWYLISFRPPCLKRGSNPAWLALTFNQELRNVGPPTEKQLNRRPRSRPLYHHHLLFPRRGRHCSQIALHPSTSPFCYFTRGQSHQRIFLQSVLLLIPSLSRSRVEYVPHGHSGTNVVALFRVRATDGDGEAAQSLHSGACERAQVGGDGGWGRDSFPATCQLAPKITSIEGASSHQLAPRPHV